VAPRGRGSGRDLLMALGATIVFVFIAIVFFTLLLRVF
jgi:hypothetical protein